VINDPVKESGGTAQKIKATPDLVAEQAVDDRIAFRHSARAARKYPAVSCGLPASR
jgi:hypothetical protein